MDASQPLANARHERFACELAKGCSQDDAYCKAGYKPDRGHAARLAANGSVLARKEWLQKQAAGDDVLTLAEKRRIAADIARKGDKDADRLNAIKVDNDLAGDGSEANKEATVVIVRIGGAGNADD